MSAMSGTCIWSDAVVALGKPLLCSQFDVCQFVEDSRLEVRSRKHCHVISGTCAIMESTWNFWWGSLRVHTRRSDQQSTLEHATAESSHGHAATMHAGNHTFLQYETLTVMPRCCPTAPTTFHIPELPRGHIVEHSQTRAWNPDW